MIPQTQERKVKNSGKVNLAISFAFHAILVVVLFYFAAREGLLGKKLEKISVEIVKKEKPPEKPKPPEPPKIEPPKVETPKMEAPKPVETHVAPQTAPPVVAPANNEVSDMDFGGGKVVETSSDPIQLYKGFIEYTLRNQWDRPENLNDDKFEADVDVAIAKDGTISDPVWQKTSGNPVWDKTVYAALAAVPKIERAPPTNFPPRVVIRFDVQLENLDDTQLQ